MNTFDAMAHAQLQAAEGNRQLASALARWIGTLANRVLFNLGRHFPSSKTSR